MFNEVNTSAESYLCVIILFDIIYLVAVCISLLELVANYGLLLVFSPVKVLQMFYKTFF